MVRVNFALPPTQKQIDYVMSLIETLGMSKESLDRLCRHQFGVPWSNMSRHDVSAIIDYIKEENDYYADANGY